ncbi:MAG: N-formylglutamate deformylase [Rickettsiales bacterium]|nr:N-formylglutamate deformylase [Rickettsiales bacterium]
MDIYNIIEPTSTQVPIIISSPHSGTYFPPEVRAGMKPEVIDNPDDADWFIDRLYDFAPSMGIQMITANYCRWVIDLNRDPDSKPLYNDGRVITGIVPHTNFNGESLYDGPTPDEQEISRRVEAYYRPYYQKVQQLLEDIKAQFGYALLFDAHSIRKVVPGIRQEPFPDLILGDNDEQSASKEIIRSAFNSLGIGKYNFQHNHPFKGGHITRYFGMPEKNIHALQLEMAKTNYMDDSETKYDEARAEEIRGILKNMFSELIKIL